MGLLLANLKVGNIYIPSSHSSLCLHVCALMSAPRCLWPAPFRTAESSLTLPFIIKMLPLPLSLLGAQDGEMLQVPLALFV